MQLQCSEGSTDQSPQSIDRSYLWEQSSGRWVLYSWFEAYGPVFQTGSFSQGHCGYQITVNLHIIPSPTLQTQWF